MLHALEEVKLEHVTTFMNLRVQIRLFASVEKGMNPLFYFKKKKNIQEVFYLRLQIVNPTILEKKNSYTNPITTLRHGDVLQTHFLLH